jgi:hypothetical protein
MLENDRKGKNIPPTRQQPQPYAQTVTPFDLWQSPSLTVVNILHLPPAAGDTMFERTQLRASEEWESKRPQGRGMK